MNLVSGAGHIDFLCFLQEIDEAYRYKLKRLKFMTRATLMKEIRSLRNRFDELWTEEGDSFRYREFPLSDTGIAVLTGIFGFHEEAEKIAAANSAILNMDRELFLSFLEKSIPNKTSARHLFDLFYARGALSMEQLAALENRYLERYIPTFRLLDENFSKSIEVDRSGLETIRDIVNNFETIIDTLSDDVRLHKSFNRDFWRLYREPAKLTIVGYGEISTVMKLSKSSRGTSIEDESPWIWKKMPPFPSLLEVLKFVRAYGEYRKILVEDIGLPVPQQKVSYFNHGFYYTVYAGQEKLDENAVCHRLIKTLDEDNASVLFKRILAELHKVQRFNATQGSISVGIDGQLSNWVLQHGDGDIDVKKDPLCYIDTSSPLYRIGGKEQLNTELFIKNAPSFLRAVIRKFFLQEVLDRYYDFKLVVTDLIANLHKEKRVDLIDPFIGIANRFLWEEGISEKNITRKEIDQYYSSDAFIWRFFQFSRKVDRFITQSILRKKYTYRLPENIER